MGKDNAAAKLFMDRARAVQNERVVEAVPMWFGEYTRKIQSDNGDLLVEVKLLSTLNKVKLNNHLGGNIEELPYKILQTLLIEGTDDEEVAEILRSKREIYLKTHPEEYKGVANAGLGIVAFDGRFISQTDWDTASDSEKRAVLVGSTCFHYNSGTPGMDSDPRDRW